MREKYNVGLVVTARVKSSRIKEKVLQRIGNKKAIEILLDNIINDKYETVLAIPENSDDDILEDIGVNKGILVYRGQDDSPLHRIAAVAKEYDFDYVVRITADDILIDLEILFNQIKFALSRQWEYCYTKRCIEGTAAEVIKSSVLFEVAGKLHNRSIEFISYYIKNKYKTIEYYPHIEFQQSFRCVLDYPEDLLFLRLLYTMLPEPIKSLDIIHFLKKNRFLTQINKLPEVTIYTCNYNTSKYIQDTIMSIMNQTFEDIEYIIIDDHSDDDSLNVIVETISNLPKEKQDRITLIRNSKNIGLSACSNKALKLARGRYIMRVDSDDTIKPECIKHMIDELRLETAEGIISGYDRVTEDFKKIETVGSNMWHPACSLLSTWACNEIKYREDIKYLDGKYFYEEWRKHFKTAFIKESLWYYRQREGQKTGEKDHPDNKWGDDC